MRYLDFKTQIENELGEHAEGFTWVELKRRLDLPYEQPCPTWVKRLEEEIGLTRSRGAGRAFIWKIQTNKP